MFSFNQIKSKNISTLFIVQCSIVLLLLSFFAVQKVTFAQEEAGVEENTIEEVNTEDSENVDTETGSTVALTEEERIQKIFDDAFARRTPEIPVNLHNNVIDDDSFLIQPGAFFEVGDPGDELSSQISILNKTGEDVIFEIHVRDISADPDSGTPRFHQPGETGPFPAKEWISPAVNEIALHHAEIATIPIKWVIPEKADAGDHMAAIMIKRKRLSEKTGGVKVNAYTSILFILTVNGDVETGGSLVSFKPQKYFNWSLPVKIEAQVQNTGTVHIAPEGELAFKNIFGIPVDAIKLPTWHVMRGVTHKKRVDWLPKFAFGYYSVETDINLNVKSGDPIPPAQGKTSFWIIPILPTLIVLFTIFLVSFLVQYFLNRFEIKRK